MNIPTPAWFWLLLTWYIVFYSVFVSDSQVRFLQTANGWILVLVHSASLRPLIEELRHLY